MGISLAYLPSGTIGTYGDLQQKIALWLDRDDLNDRIPDFVALCEARLNRHLRTLNSEIRAIWTIDTETFDLPPDFRALRTLWIEGHPDDPLRNMSPNAIPNEFSGAPGVPKAYALSNRTLILSPPPYKAMDFQAIYFRALPPLTVNDQTNWLLNENPDIYFAGTLAAAAEFIRDDTAVSYWDGRFELFFEELKASSRRDRWGGAPLTPNAVRQTRGGRC